jgi:hypothetical protein
MSIVVAAVAMSSHARSPKQFDHRPYDEVRAELIKSGYRPVRLKHDASDLFCRADNFCGRYPEVLNCDGTGINPCVFAFIRPASRKYIAVITYGEVRLKVSDVRAPSIDDMQIIQQRQ